MLTLNASAVSSGELKQQPSQDMHNCYCCCKCLLVAIKLTLLHVSICTAAAAGYHSSLLHLLFAFAAGASGSAGVLPAGAACSVWEGSSHRI
jgi:hypothetical protein